MKKLAERLTSRNLVPAFISGFLLVSLSHADTETRLWNERAEVEKSASINHGAWTNILRGYVVKKSKQGGPVIHLFDYKKLNDAAKDKASLQRYIKSLAAIDPRHYSRDEQKAYWINLYNALTVSVILDHYPVKSIRKLGEGVFSFGPWDDEMINVAGETLTLNDIEHKILRPIWQDSRIHYAVNCASYSCPNLAAKAYTAKNIDEMLEVGARNYINHPRGVRFDKGDIEASSIYDWYKDDFGGSNTSLIQHWVRYAEPALKTKLQRFDGDIHFDYDWNLNQP